MLDHLCGGRFGWDIVTSGEDLAAETFGIDTRSTLRETLTEF
jgi:alkanesulfonate monooxygenase SsuD/methylene tetrahydromethanopterin reductase-like flavin-dependent oxidoreductase (luciferase family)